MGFIYGTDTSVAMDVFAGTVRAPFVAGTSTPLIRSHVSTTESVPLEFPNWIDVMIS